MQVRPTVMAAALLNSAIKKTNHPAAKSVLYHAMADDPKKPFATGYNRSITNNIRVSEATLREIS